MSMLHGIATFFGKALRNVHAGEGKIAFNDPRLACDSRLAIEADGLTQGGPLPLRYTKDGGDASPPIRWSGVPDTARELVLLCEDPDAPLPTPFVHWVVYRISPAWGSLPEGLAKDAIPDAPTFVLQGKNTTRKPGYTGAAPPLGHGAHRYHFQLFALDEPIRLEAGATRDEVVRAMEGHVVAKGELVATYERA